MDPVAQRLSEADGQSARLVNWLDSQQNRNAMRRNANWCTIRGWGLMAIAALISSVVAVMLSNSMRELVGSGSGLEIFDLTSYERNPLQAPAISWLPWAIVLISAVFIAGGITMYFMGRIPGLRRTTSAVEWASISDAISRLLDVGCTYPEAFRTASEIAKSWEAKHWLVSAAVRVERGQPAVTTSRLSHGDMASLELMVEAGSAEPQRQWGVVSQHFHHLASQRLTSYQHMMPVFSTIISGFLIWISISSSLSWIWRSMSQMITGLT